MALRSDWSTRTCSMARGLDILGDPWSMLVLREVFFGNGRFDAMKSRLAVADSVLTKRLVGPGGVRAAQQKDVRRRRPHPPGVRPDPKGEDALPVLNAVRDVGGKAPARTLRAGPHVRDPLGLRAADQLGGYLHRMRRAAHRGQHQLAQPHPLRGSRGTGHRRRVAGRTRTTTQDGASHERHRNGPPPPAAPCLDRGRRRLPGPGGRRRFPGRPGRPDGARCSRSSAGPPPSSRRRSASTWCSSA